MNDSFKKLLCNFKQGLSYVTLREEKKKRQKGEGEDEYAGTPAMNSTPQFCHLL